jgi:hypothetical protein
MSAPVAPAFAAAGASTVAALLALIGSAAASQPDASFYVGLGPFVLVIAFIIALTHAFGVGLPLYSLVPLDLRASVWTSLCGSFLVGAVPMPLLVFLFSGGLEDLASGSTGIDALASYLWAGLALGGCGSAGGIVFWLFLGKATLEEC